LTAIILRRGASEGTLVVDEDAERGDVVGVGVGDFEVVDLEGAFAAADGCDAEVAAVFGLEGAAGLQLAGRSPAAPDDPEGVFGSAGDGGVTDAYVEHGGRVVDEGARHLLAV
jgi:hypothetical protein